MDARELKLECVKVAVGMHRLPSATAEDVIKTSTSLYNFVVQDDVSSSGSSAEDKPGRGKKPRPDPVS